MLWYDFAIYVQRIVSLTQFDSCSVLFLSLTAHYAEVVTDATPPGQHTAVLTSMTQNHVMTMLGFFYRLGAPNTLTVVARLDGGDVETLWSRNGTEDSGSWIEVDLPVPKSSSFQVN